MMSDRADTEADLGTRPPLGEVLDFSGAESLGPPRRRPRPASRALGVECRAPVLLLRRRAWLRAAVSATGISRVRGSVCPSSISPLGPSALRRQSPFFPGRCVHSPASWPLFRRSLFLHTFLSLLTLGSSTLQVPYFKKPSPHPSQIPNSHSWSSPVQFLSPVLIQ